MQPQCFSFLSSCSSSGWVNTNRRSYLVGRVLHSPSLHSLGFQHLPFTDSSSPPACLTSTVLSLTLSVSPLSSLSRRGPINRLVQGRAPFLPPHRKMSESFKLNILPQRGTRDAFHQITRNTLRTSWPVCSTVDVYEGETG